MVRRRTRASKTGPAATVTVNAASNDQYFASPKRKDCKMDKNVLTECEEETNKEPPNENHRSEVGALFATRSQTKTLDNFFKVQTAVNRGQVDVTLGTSEPSLPSLHLPSANEQQQFIAINGYKDKLELSESDIQLNNVCKQPDFVFDLSEDTNDTDNTELSDEATATSSSGGIIDVHDFITHRSPIRDSHSSRSSFATDNIFLQEPVLTLNVDKTPNQASSIKINKSLEIEHIFSTPPTLAASAASGLNGRFNQIVSLNVSHIKRESFGFETKPILPDNDNSSCDSGVVFASSLDNSQSLPTCNASQTRRRKPATPHRIIVCASPVKSGTHVISANTTGSESPARKVPASKEQLSPRKSPRHLTPAVAKTRRRLNSQSEQQPAACIDNHIQEFECVLKSANHTSGKAISANHKYSTKGNHQKAIKSSTNGIKQQQPKIKHEVAQPLISANGNRELTEFFPVRRSVRKTKTVVKEEMMRNLERAVIEERVDGLKVASFEGKGRGIVADRRFKRGDFVVEYVGDLISTTEATEREKRYALDENAGCYMYYFKHKNQQYCIDATEDTGKLGRLVNHSRNGNLITKVVVVKQRPHLILVAKDDIEADEELTYDYGDRSKESLLHHPWLAF